MWKAVKTLNSGYLVGFAKSVKITKFHMVDGKFYETPYQSEAQELADKLNGDSDEH